MNNPKQKLKSHSGQAQWLMPVISATEEAEIGGLVGLIVLEQPKQKVSKTTSQPTSQVQCGPCLGPNYMGSCR
jgi:hypothetical protein